MRKAVACSYRISKEKTDAVSSFGFSREISRLLESQLFYEVGFCSTQLLLNYYIDGTAELTFILYLNE